MKTLKPIEVKSIEQFFQLTQEKLLKVMGRYLETKYKTVYKTQEYIVAVGDIPVAIVAHLDTVFPTPPIDIFYDRVKNVMWSPDGLGADDRAGVYSIIQLVKMGLKPTIIFTTDEETGAAGAMQLVKDMPNGIPNVELKYIIQLDRRGSTDCVFYDCDNVVFEEYVEQFGFVTAYGTFSDISVICPAWKIAGVNLSIGYIDEHSYSEILYVGNMLATIKKVANMLMDIENVKEPFEYIPLCTKTDKYYNKLAYTYGYDYTDDDYGWDPSYGVPKTTWKSWHTPKDMIRCYGCDNQEYDYNVVPVKSTNGTTIFLCGDCINQIEYLRWCEICGEAFLMKEGDQNRECCYDCAKEDTNDINSRN